MNARNQAQTDPGQSTSPAAVISAALATEEELGPWLARNWGILADAPPDLLEPIDR